MNITEEAIVNIANSLKSISDSLNVLAQASRIEMKESKKKNRAISKQKTLNESIKQIKLGKSPKEAIDSILRKEIFQ